MTDINSFNDEEHLLVRLLRAYEPVALVYYMPSISGKFGQVCADYNIGIWLTSEVPCVQYFAHELIICRAIDEAFGRERYAPIILNSAPQEIKRAFVRYGHMVYARSEADHVSFVISANTRPEPHAYVERESRREMVASGGKIVELGRRAFVRRDGERKGGMIIDFRRPTVHA